MNTEKKTLKIEMAKKMDEFYAYCGYEITKPQVVSICDNILILKSDITIDEFNKFMEACSLGRFGMIYKSPVSLMVAFNQFNKPKFVF